MSDVSAKIPAALAGLEAWLETVRTPAGYGGPTAGVHRLCLGYCGPGFDWRYEGILDGRRRVFEQTGEPACLVQLESDLKTIPGAQLANGTFRSSYFEFNPFEGGMPHEPAMLAAACRACACLSAAGRRAPSELTAAVEKYIELYLLRELWNKRLRTCNDWPISEFQYYAPNSAAAVAELLMDFGALTGDVARFEPEALSALDSILRLQAVSGPNAGAIPDSSRPGEAISPFLAARCLPALAKGRDRFSSLKFGAAVENLVVFLKSVCEPDGIPPRLVFGSRPAVRYPVYTGLVAGMYAAAERAGVLGAFDAVPAVARLIERQHGTGAFDTVMDGRCALPEWFHVIPTCGWLDKLYALLAALHGPTRAGWDGDKREIRPCRFRREKGQLVEDARSIRVETESGTTVYSWEKGADWAEICPC